MIIQMDAWNIRERDAWGQSAAWRRRGEEPERWHWVYPGTVFRMDHRGHTAGGRPVISERGFVATRQGIDGLREQLHAEALRRGLGQAAGALVIGDGAVWIWRLADDRFPEARQRLDFYHAVQHLAAVGRALFGEDKEKYRSWLKPLVRQLKNQSSVEVIGQLEEALRQMPAGVPAQTVAKEIEYFREHQSRMDYRAGRRRLGHHRFTTAEQAAAGENGSFRKSEKSEKSEVMEGGVLSGMAQKMTSRFACNCLHKSNLQETM